MGLLRILLALSVVLNHLGGIHGYSIAGGLAAVQVFYIISGFYMETVLREKYDPRRDLGVFYASRALRIYSVYFAALAVSLVVYAALYLQGGGLFAHIAANADRLGTSAKAWLALVTFGVFGQDVVLYQKLGADGLLFNAGGNFGPDPDNSLAWKFMALPQAWSISLELMFYCIVPFLTRLRTVHLIGIVGASLALRIGLYAAGYGGDPWIYRFFPLELALFVYGMLARRFYDAHIGAFSVGLRRTVGWAFIAATCLVETVPDLLGLPRTAAVWPYYATALIALPCLFTMGNHADDRLAELSYPVYMIHWIVIVAYGAAAPALLPAGWIPVLQVPLCVLGAIAGGWAIVTAVERPVDRFRHSLLQRRPRLQASDMGLEIPNEAKPRRAVDGLAGAVHYATAPGPAFQPMPPPLHTPPRID
jgi:peptidoglycan/LPS O-acetylase OafA/YrhL